MFAFVEVQGSLIFLREVASGIWQYAIFRLGGDNMSVGFLTIH